MKRIRIERNADIIVERPPQQNHVRLHSAGQPDEQYPPERQGGVMVRIPWQHYRHRSVGGREVYADGRRIEEAG